MYIVGQKVCLWQEVVTAGQVLVLKEVIVTITETKTGVFGRWSQKPVTQMSLRGLGDDGKVYEKHWESWPESQTNDLISQWSMRDDGVGGVVTKYWTPKEAVYAHNELRSVNKRLEKKLVRIDINGNTLVPKGDIVHCAKHDEYNHQGDTCFSCYIESQKIA